MSLFHTSKPSSYTQENGFILIDLHIDSYEEFYNMLDPSPEERRDLNENTELYIKNAIEDLTVEERKRAKIVLYMTSSLYQNSQTRKNMVAAVSANFAFRLHNEERKYDFAMIRGKRYLIRGLLFLVICLLISGLFPHVFSENDINLALAQSFVIIGWVALWKPVEFYLYDRRDILDDLEILKTLTMIPVESRKGDLDDETLVLM